MDLLSSHFQQMFAFLRAAMPRRMRERRVRINLHQPSIGEVPVTRASHQGKPEAKSLLAIL
jgi:hypothetical protein